MSNTATLDFTPVSVTLENAGLWIAAKVNEKLDAVNVRLAKLGAPLATVEFGPIVDFEIKDEFTGVKSIERRFEFVTLNGFEAKFSGWTPVATLDHTLVADEALVAKFPGKDETAIPEAFRFEGPVCDHCGVLRNRNNTVVFLNETTGEWVRVGTSCILDFIGIDPANVLWIVGYFDDVKESAYESAREGHLQGPDPIRFLAFAAEVTREYGFVPSQCDFLQTSTKEHTWLAIEPPKNKKLSDVLPNFDADRANEAAFEICRWVNGQDSANSDFIQSAQLAIRADIVSRRTAGILAALPHVFRKATEREEDKAAQKPSEFVGTVGGKVDVVGTIIVANQYHTDFGVSMLIVVRTDEGDRLSTFGSGRTLFGSEVGDRVTVKGTVKEHKNDEKYGKETKLTRVKLDDIVE